MRNKYKIIQESTGLPYKTKKGEMIVMNPESVSVECYKGNVK